MDISSQLMPELTGDEIMLIDRLHHKIIDNKLLGNEDLLLLKDCVLALKNNLFFASASSFFVLLEKYLRMELIKSMAKEKGSAPTEFMKILEDIEENIEDWVSWKKYMFNDLCDSLTWKYFDEWFVSKLKDIYKKYRIPVQHGIYWRLVKQQIWNQQQPMVAMSFEKDADWESMMKTMKDMMTQAPNTTAGAHNPIFRPFILPSLLKSISIELLELIDEMVTIIISKK